MSAPIDTPPVLGSLANNQLCGLDYRGRGTYTTRCITKLCEALKGSAVTSLKCATNLETLVFAFVSAPIDTLALPPFPLRPSFAASVATRSEPRAPRRSLPCSKRRESPSSSAPPHPLVFALVSVHADILTNKLLSHYIHSAPRSQSRGQRHHRRGQAGPPVRRGQRCPHRILASKRGRGAPRRRPTLPALACPTRQPRGLACVPIIDRRLHLALPLEAHLATPEPRPCSRAARVAARSAHANVVLTFSFLPLPATPNCDTTK